MRKLALLVLGIAILSCCSALAFAADKPAPATPATLSQAQPSLDPYLGSPIQSRVPMARQCRDEIPSVCQYKAPGDPCDTPVGCICGYSSGQLRCGRFH